MRICSTERASRAPRAAFLRSPLRRQKVEDLTLDAHGVHLRQVSSVRSDFIGPVSCPWCDAMESGPDSSFSDSAHVIGPSGVFTDRVIRHKASIMQPRAYRYLHKRQALATGEKMPGEPETQIETARGYGMSYSRANQKAHQATACTRGGNMCPGSCLSAADLRASPSIRGRSDRSPKQVTDPDRSPASVPYQRHNRLVPVAQI